MLYFIVALGVFGWMPFCSNALKYAESPYLPIQLQCSCLFLNAIQVRGISFMGPGGQWVPAENIYPGIEAAADHECRQQLANGLKKCDLYLKGFNAHMGSGAKVRISYDCLAGSSDFDIAFSEGTDDIALQCPSIKHNIDIKEIKVEDGQVPVSVLRANQDCAKHFSLQKMWNFVPLQCNIKRDGRHGCMLVEYECKDADDNGGSAVFPPPGFGK